MANIWKCLTLSLKGTFFLLSFAGIRSVKLETHPCRRQEHFIISQEEIHKLFRKLTKIEILSNESNQRDTETVLYHEE